MYTFEVGVYYPVRIATPKHVHAPPKTKINGSFERGYVDVATYL